MAAGAEKSSEAKVAKWNRPWVGIALVVLSLIALYCAFGLLASELQVLHDPDSALGCDINPLVGCSDSLMSSSAHLFFGFPNSAVGLLAFGALLGVSAVLMFGNGLPQFLWWVMTAGITLGMGYVAYFLYLSVAVFDSLCPYCMGIWFAILSASPLIWFSALASGAFGKSARRNGKVLLRYWWAVAIGLYLIVILVIVLGMPDKIAMLF